MALTGIWAHFDDAPNPSPRVQHVPAVAKLPAPSPAPPQPTLGASGLLTCTTAISTATPGSRDVPYIFDIVGPSSGDAIAVSLSTNIVKIYALQQPNSSSGSPGGLQRVGDLGGHTGRITDIAFPFAAQPHALFSCSRDGSLKGWDARSGQVVEELVATGHELNTLSVGGGGNLAVAGGQGELLFWDRRTRQQLSLFEDTHGEAVTQVMFRDEASMTLLSASVDGQLAVFDLSAGLDEDDAFQGGLNLEDSVVRMGLYGREGSSLWVTTATEALYTWEWSAACDEISEGGEGPSVSVPDAREPLSAAAAVSPFARQLAPQMDYLINCQYDPAGDRLWLEAGTNSGSVGFFPVDGSGASPGGAALSAPVAALSGGHSTVVRSVYWPGAAAWGCVTGGEDGKLCLWAANAAAQSGKRKKASRVREG